jgi:hypothetical protein
MTGNRGNILSPQNINMERIALMILITEYKHEYFVQLDGKTRSACKLTQEVRITIGR